MKRTRLKNRSEKRDAWNDDYQRLKESYVPTECARCGLKGEGWTSDGKDFDFHHPMLRGTHPFMMCGYALCKPCHTHIHANPNKAREEGWLIKPVRVDIFGNRRP